MHAAARVAERYGVLAQLDRHRVEHQARRCRTPRSPRARPLRPGSVVRLAVAAELEPLAGLGVQGQQHPVQVGREHQRAGGQVVGVAGPGHPVGVRGEVGDVAVAERRLLGRRRLPRRQHGQRVGVEGHSCLPSSPSDGRRDRCRPRAGPSARRRSPRRSSSPARRRPRGSRAGRRGRPRSAAGRGASTRRRGPRCPGGCAASPTASTRRAAAAAAARGRRGRRRSARPDRRPRGGGVRPPGAWPPPASARRWPGRRPRRPSPRPARG